MKLVRASMWAAVLLLAGGISFAEQQDPEAAIRLFADAERLESEGDLEAALRNYELMVQQFPQATIADDALLRVARGRWTMGNEAAARLAIETLKSDYARSPGAAGAFVLDGDIRVATAGGFDDLEEAREQYRNAVLLFGRAEFPNLEWRAQALLRAGEVSVWMGEPDDAAAAFLAAIEDETSSEWTEPARLRLATVLMRNGHWAPAAEILQRIIDEGIDEIADDDPETEVMSAARRRLELGYRLLLRPEQSLSPWTGARQVRFSGPQLKDPEGVDAAEDNRIVIVDPGIPLVAVVETDGTLSTRVASSEASHPWWAPDSATAHVATRKSVSMPISRERQEFLAPDGDEMKALEGIVAGTRGIYRQWLLLDSNRKEVMLFDDSAEYMSALMGEGSEPVDIAIDQVGRFYVLDRRAKAVFRFDADGGGRTSFVQRDWRRPEALAVDGLDNVYVLDRDAKMIDVFSPEGELLWQLGPQLPGGIELKSPRDIGVDGSGRIYIAARELKAFLVLE